jgi:hypothetical protein
MSNVVQTFIESMRRIEESIGSNRRLQIRKTITQYENILRSNLADAEAIRSFLRQAKDVALAEITHRSTQSIPTPTADFFDEVADSLATRILTSIEELNDGTFQVNVSVPGLPQVVKNDFSSLKIAQDWIDSDTGNQIIKDVISKFRPS